MTLPRCRTLHFLLVIVRRFLSDPFCSLVRTLWMQHTPPEYQPCSPICKCAEGGPCPSVMDLWNWPWHHPWHKTCAADNHTLNPALSQALVQPCPLCSSLRLPTPLLSPQPPAQSSQQRRPGWSGMTSPSLPLPNSCSSISSFPGPQRWPLSRVWQAQGAALCTRSGGILPEPRPRCAHPRCP